MLNSKTRTRWLGRSIATLLTCAAVAVSSGHSALADCTSTSNSASCTGTPALLTTSTTSTTTTAGVAGILYSVLGKKSSAQMERYIRNNAFALKQDITIGGGSTVRDLASAYHVSPRHMDAFGRLIRSERATLLPLTNLRKLNRARAAKFARVIYDGMANDPTLAGDLVVQAS